MFRDLIGRTIAMVSLATALVAVAIALDLPRTGGDAGHGAHGVAGTAHAPIASEAAFLAAMVPHHQEAVDVALEVVTSGERPEVRALAAEIVATQAQEIAQLRAWLDAWYPDEPAAAYEPMMRNLEGLTPPAVDVVFVLDMIHHHEMALAMAEEVLGLRPPPRPEVVELAREIVRVQGEEIEVLQAWIDAWWPAGALRNHEEH